MRVCVRARRHRRQYTVAPSEGSWFIFCAASRGYALTRGEWSEEGGRGGGGRGGIFKRSRREPYRREPHLSETPGYYRWMFYATHHMRPAPPRLVVDPFFGVPSDDDAAAGSRKACARSRGIAREVARRGGKNNLPLAEQPSSVENLRTDRDPNMVFVISIKTTSRWKFQRR